MFGTPHEVAPDVFMVPSFVNTYVLRSNDGLAIIDPGFQHTAGNVHEAVRTWSTAPLRVAVYTHGHADHAFGLGPFLKAGDQPAIIAQERCVDRFNRYREMHGQNAHINQRQFQLPRPMFPDRFDWPTVLVRDQTVQQLGDLELELHAARGETDDHLWAWVPARRYLFVGDLIIWFAPNCGNPQKVQRYPVDWAATLERLASLDAEWLFPGHGLVIHGRDAIRTVLQDTARYLRVLIDAVRTRLNAGETPEQVYEAVDADPELAKLPYLQAHYDHPKFIVRNLLRLWGGWWMGNAAELLPAPSAVQAQAIAALAGGVDAIVARGRAHLDNGETVLAAHHAEWGTRAEPGHAGAQALKRDVYLRRHDEEPSLMARGIYRAAARDAERALESNGG